MNEPIIRAMPTEEQFKRLVDTAVSYDTPDDEINALIQLILTPANSEDDHQWGLATSAARHAFTKTSAFERAFRLFAGHPETPGFVADRYVIEAGREV